jgi:cell division initiation protein
MQRLTVGVLAILTPMEQERGPSHRAAQRLRQTDFPLALRGYDREAVDRYVADVLRIVTELEATQSRDTVVQRALEEVGEETSGILQRAHQTAEEVNARARAQAEGRMQRAEREAEGMIAEAKAEAQRLRAELVAVWRERERLIEDLRRFSDEILAVADDALERVPTPEGAVAEEAPAEPAAPQEAVGDEAAAQETASLEAPPQEPAIEPRPEPPVAPPGPSELPAIEGPAVRRVGPEHRTR